MTRASYIDVDEAKRYGLDFFRHWPLKAGAHAAPFSFLVVLSRLQALGGGLGHAMGARTRPAADEEHVRRAIAWLATAQKAAGGGGFAHSFGLLGGWKPAYPETTGYILPTLVRAGARFGIPETDPLVECAAQWLASIQQPDGSFSDLSGRAQIFDTGQILYGWNELTTLRPELVERERVARAAHWIAAQQEADGRFERNTWGGARSYYVRVGAALVNAGQNLGDASLVEAGQRNIGWTLAQQRQNGFFDRAGFDERPPFLHTMVYVVEGLLDAFVATRQPELLDAVLRFVEPLRLSAGRGTLPCSRYHPDFVAVGRELCLPGLAQWAAQCRRLVALGFTAYREAGAAAVAALKRHQLFARTPDLDGGLFGSAPVWGHYMRWSIPNWGVKFLIDALLAESAGP